MEIFIFIWVFILGTCFGSFANVVIYRWPKDLSLVSPPSQCPSCGKKIKFYENIPIFSWIFLKGKCSVCKVPISVSYPLVEALTGLIFVVIYLSSGITWTTVDLFVFTIFAVPCFFIDLKHMYLPDIMTLTGLAAALILSFFNPDRTVLSAFLGALFGGGSFWLLAYFYKKWRGVDGMGGGDIKLLAWLGALFGVQSLPMIMLLSSVTGSLIGAYMVLTQKKDSQTYAIPFGPFLILAAYAYYFLEVFKFQIF